jgi:lysophospholipase L1-like esterase
VIGPPRLSATKFVAFGDSITEGVLDPPCRTTSVRGLSAQVDELRLLEQSVNNPTSYPTKLQGLLTSRYTLQMPDVINEGKAGEGVAAGGLRLPGVLSTDRPQILLLEEGINDIDASNPAPSIAYVVNGLASMIQQARDAGVQQVFVANFLPERAGACRGERAGAIVPANNQIQPMVVANGAVLVDLYAAFGGEASPPLIGFDGLHPTAAGYELIAQTFFDAIRKKLEVTATAARVR